MTIALRHPAAAVPCEGNRPTRDPARAAAHPEFWRRLLDPKARRIARELAEMPAYLRRDIGLPD